MAGCGKLDEPVQDLTGERDEGSNDSDSNRFDAGFVAHLYKVDKCHHQAEDDEKDNTINDIHEEEDSKKFCCYLPVSIGNKATSALLDSGNLFHSAISLKFLNELGINESSIERTRRRVGTAKKGSQMKVLGKLKKPLIIQLGNLPTKFKFDPYVIEDLHMPINISGSFMQKYNIDQLHSRNCIKVMKTEIPLFTTQNCEKARRTEAIFSVATFKEDRVIKALHIATVKLEAEEVKKNNMPHGEGILTGSEEMMTTTNLNPYICVLSQCSKDGEIIAQVMNTTPNDKQVYKGQPYGHFTLTSYYNKEAILHQHRPRIMSLSPKPDKPDTRTRNNREGSEKSAVQENASGKQQSEQGLTKQSEQGLATFGAKTEPKNDNKAAFDFKEFQTSAQLTKKKMLQRFNKGILESQQSASSEKMDPDQVKEELVERYKRIQREKLTPKSKQAGIRNKYDSSRTLEVSENSDPPEEWPDERKREWLIKELRLRDSPYLKEREEDFDEALRLGMEYFDVFSKRGETGKTELMQFELNLTNDVPIHTRTRPMNPILEGHLKEQMQHWIDLDCIEPSSSSYSFAIICAPKKGGKIRFAIDLRRLNDQCLKDQFPLPSIADNLSRLAGNEVFSSIDLSGAFHAMKVKKEDRHKLAFSTPWGLFQWKRCPFGICGAPAAYSRLIQMTLQGIPTTMVIPFLDDFLLISKTVKEHHVIVKRVYEAIRAAGLKIQASKSSLYAEEVIWLGHRVTKDGVGIVQDYGDIIAKWPTPQTRSALRIFNGKCSFYRRFIKDYSKIAGPLMKLAGKGTPQEEKEPIVFTPEMTKAFTTLKQKLLSAPILAYPDFESKEPFILSTDFSQTHSAIGATLSQRGKDGIERVICYAAKRLNDSQKLYSPWKGETFSAIWFCQYLRFFLLGRKFILRCDAEALKSFKTMTQPKGMVARWLEIIGHFDFDTEHIAGSKNVSPDALSRIDHAEQLTDEEAGDEIDLAVLALFAIRDVNTDNGEPVELTSAFDLPFSREQLKNEQAKDEVTGTVYKWLKGQEPIPDRIAAKGLEPELRHYHGQLDQLSFSPGGLLLRSKLQHPSWPSSYRRVPILPKCLQFTVLESIHIISGHAGRDSTLARLASICYFTKMKQMAAEHCASCPSCQRKRRLTDKGQRHTLASLPTGYPFQKIYCDYVDLDKSHQGNSVLFTVKCGLTRWVEAYACNSANTQNALRFLINDIFMRYGISELLVSDNAAAFKSKQFVMPLARLGCKWSPTMTYNPRNNSVERSHQDIGNMIRALAGDQPQNWEDFLPQAMFAIRTSVNRSTGFSPYQLLFARNPAMPLQTAFGSPPEIPDESGNFVEYAEKLRARVDLAQAYARKHLAKAIARQRSYYNQNKKSFQVGQEVWLYTKRKKIGQRAKTSLYWSGPHTVTKQFNEVSYGITPNEGVCKKRVEMAVAIDRLHPYRRMQEHSADRQTTVPMGEGDDQATVDDEDEFGEYVAFDHVQEEPIDQNQERQGQVGQQPNPDAPLPDDRDQVQERQELPLPDDRDQVQERQEVPPPVEDYPRPQEIDEQDAPIEEHQQIDDPDPVINDDANNTAATEEDYATAEEEEDPARQEEEEQPVGRPQRRRQSPVRFEAGGKGPGGDYV